MGTETPHDCKQCSLYYDPENFCACLSSNELTDLNKESRTVKMKRNESFTDDALLQWPIVAISSGVLSLQHILEDGRKSIAALFTRGDIVDLRSISNRNRGSLIALGASEVCRLSPAVFELIVADNPSASRIVWDNLREQTFRAIDHSVDLAKKQALEKLASFIFECSHRDLDQSKNRSKVNIPIRRIDLAEYIGMQPETVSRCFRDLEDKGIIEFEKLSALTIKNIPALRRIANGDKDLSEAHMPTRLDMKILSFG